MTALASAITAGLIDFAWQGVLIVCLLWIVLFTLRGQSARARYLVCCAALLTMFIVPVITVWTTFEALQSAAFSAAITGPHLPSIVMAVQAGAFPESDMPKFGMLWLRWIETWALPAWSIGVLLFSCRLISGCFQLSLLRRRGIRVPEALGTAANNLARRMGLTRSVRVLLSTIAETPGVAGFLRPVILLPISSVTGLTAQQLEAILAHELAHIRRLDPVINALQILIETLLFYHPAVWWTSARIRHERELCCDDEALRYCGDALGYARALTAMERLRSVPAAMVLGAAGGSLLYRVRRIMGERPKGYSPSTLSGMLALALAMVCLVFNFNSRMQAQEQPTVPPTVHMSPGVEADIAGAEVRQPIRYPRSAAEKAIQGTVVAQLDVDANGSITDARVLSGPPELRKAVLLAVLTWHYPAGGSAATRQVSVTFQVPPLQELPPDENLGERLRAPEAELEARRMAELDMKLQSLAKGQAALNMYEQIHSSQAAVAEAMAAVQQQLAAVAADQQPFSGRVLSRIDIDGLSEEQREQLKGRMPVKIGDTLSAESVDSIRRIIRGIDRQIKFALIPIDNNQAVLKIGVRGGYVYVAPGPDGDQVSELDQATAKMEAQLDMARRTLTDLHPDVLALKAKLMALRQQQDAAMRQVQENVVDDGALAALKAQLGALDRELSELLVWASGRPDTAELEARIHQVKALREMQMALYNLRLNELAGKPRKEPASETRESPAK
jgi:TonB family protein